MPEPPNFLFLFPDQWRWDFLGCAGYGIPVGTPTMDALAERGVLFEQCRTNSPLCAPARASLIQGLGYERCGVPDNKVNSNPREPNFVKQLREAGYRTSACGKLDLFKPEKFRGLQGWTEQVGEIGFDLAADQSGKLDAAGAGRESPMDSYSAFLHRQGLMERHVEDYRKRREMRQSGLSGGWASPLPTPAHTDEFTAANALALLGRLPQDQPWLLWVNFPGPHDPFDPPEEYLQIYSNVDFPLPRNSGGRDSAEVLLAMRRSYAACCTHIDTLCGRILDAVRRRGEADNTVVVFASDHGEMLGDRGCWGKSVPYEGSVHVPLIVAGPGIGKGRRTGALVELSDLAATFCDLADAAPVPGWDSISLRPLLENRADRVRDVTRCGLGNWRIEFDGRRKHIFRGGQLSEIYDLASDPAEQINLCAGSTGQLSTTEKLRTRPAFSPKGQTADDEN